MSLCLALWRVFRSCNYWTKKEPRKGKAVYLCAEGQLWASWGLWEGEAGLLRNRGKESARLQDQNVTLVRILAPVAVCLCLVRSTLKCFKTCLHGGLLSREKWVTHAVSINHELHYRVRLGVQSNGTLFLNLPGVASQKPPPQDLFPPVFTSKKPPSLPPETIWNPPGIDEWEEEWHFLVIVMIMMMMWMMIVTGFDRLSETLVLSMFYSSEI